MILQVCETRLYWRGSIMCMPHPTFESPPSLRPSQIADLRLAASKMSGPKRRAFEAEMTLKYCGGNPLAGRNDFRVGPSYCGGGARRETNGNHLSRGASSLQRSPPLGRRASRGR